VVRAVLEDFFHSMLPSPSMFELNSRFRNRYLHISELRKWFLFRSVLSTLCWFCVGILVFLMILNYYSINLHTLYSILSNTIRKNRAKINTV